MKKVTIYTDGACSGNPGPGGWGAILMYGKARKEISGGEQDTTNNRMEMLAAIRALQKLSQRCLVDIYTDSVYVQKGITEWIIGWKRNNWKNSAKKPVKNSDLWQELDQLCELHEINWHWVKAHSDNELNNQVDSLAVKAREEVARSMDVDINQD